MILESIGWGDPRASLEDPSTPFGQALLESLDGSSMTPAGVSIGADTRNLDVQTCVRIIAETVAMLPFHVMEQDRGGKTRRVPDHPVRRLIAGQASLTMSGYSFRESLVSDVLAWGNGYALRIPDGEGGIGSLRYVPASHIKPEADPEYGRIYVLQTGGTPRVLLPGDVFHVMWRTRDGVVGLSPIMSAQDEVAISEAQAQFAARFYGQGSFINGVIQYDGKMSAEAADRLRKRFERLHAGVQRSHRVAVLDEGMTFNQSAVNIEELQLVESRNFSASRIAAFYRLTPDRINIFEKAATYASLDATEVRHVKDAIQPVCTRIEAEIDRQLLKRWGGWDSGSVQPQPPSTDRWCKFNLDAVLRGDPKTRAEVQLIYKRGGVLNSNEIRDQEDLDELPPEIGEVYYVEENMRPATLPYPDSRTKAETPPESESADDGADDAADDDGQDAAAQAAPSSALVAICAKLSLGLSQQREIEARLIAREVKDGATPLQAAAIVLNALRAEDVEKRFASAAELIGDPSAARELASAYVERCARLCGSEDSEHAALVFMVDQVQKRGTR